MGTVRNTTGWSAPAAGASPSPSSSGKKSGKRKAASLATAKARRAYDADDLSVAHALAQDMLDERLASRDKWQVCTQRNLSLIRTECMSVRRELGRVEEVADAVQMHVDEGLTAYTQRREEIQQFINEQREQMQGFAEKFEAAEKLTAEHKDVTQRQLAKMNKRLESHVEKQQKAVAGLVDDESLLTHFAGFEERREAELAAAKSELEERFERQLRTVMEDMNRKFAELQEGLRRNERDESVHEQRSQSDSHELHAEVQQLLQRVAELEHDSDRLRTDNAQLKQSLEASRQQAEGFDDRLIHLSRDLERQAHTLRTLPPPVQHHYPPPLPPHPPPPLPSPVNLGPLEQKLHFLARDVGVMADDYSRWKNHADANYHTLRQEMLARVGELENALFKALKYDSEQHKFENHRLKDACFDTRADVGALRKELHIVRDKLEEDLRMLAQTRLQNAPSPRRVHGGGRYESPVRFVRRRSRSPSPPMRHRRDGPSPPRSFGRRISDVEQSYLGGPFYATRSRSRSPPPPGGRRSRESSPRRPRSRSRSRSRSRTRAHHGPPPTTTEMLYRPLNRPDEPDRRPSSADAPMDPYSGGPYPAGARPPRRPSRPREVIVIEDGDEEGEVNSNEAASDSGGAATTSTPVPPPHMAPPDPVLDEADERVATIQRELMDERLGGNAASTPVPETDEQPPPPQHQRAATIADLRVGALLYACFGGAPTLAREWTAFFAPLRSSDCVDASEMLQFQVQYPAVAAHPPFLSQFVVKAFQVQGEAFAPQDSSAADVLALASVDANRVASEFGQILAALRDEWTRLAIQLLTDALAQHSEGVALTAPPSLEADATVEAERAFLKAHGAWAQAQTSVLTALLNQQQGDWGDVWRAVGVFKPAPGVLVFLACFDVVEASREHALDARFRLNAFGRALLAKLWECALNKVPLPLFVECSWLDDQSAGPKRTMPLLAVAHVLTTVLLHFSPRAQLLHGDKRDHAVAQSVRLLATALRVGGKALGETDVVQGLGDASPPLELELKSLEWPQAVNLDSFAEVVRLLGEKRQSS